MQEAKEHSSGVKSSPSGSKGLMVFKMGPRVPKMVKAGFKVVQDSPRRYKFMGIPKGSIGMWQQDVSF